MPIDFSAINKEQKIDFSSLGKEVDFSTLDKDEDSDVVDNLPDTLQVGFWQTPSISSEKVPEDIRLKREPLEISPEVSAFVVGAGHMMQDVYRGVKQMAGIDEETMKRNEMNMFAIIYTSLYIILCLT